MLAITAHRVDQIKDPYGIIAGDRYEFFLDIEVPEDDELFSGQGAYVRVIYGVEGNRSGIVKYEIYEQETNRYLDFELEDEELEEAEAFCKMHVPGAAI